MPILNALSQLIGAGQQPDPNPLYGAQYVTPDDYAKHAPPGTPPIQSPIWLDAHGNDVTQQINAIPQEQRQTITSQPFKTGGFWRGLGSVGQAEKSANMQAEEYPGQQSQALQADLLRNTGVYNNALQNRIGGAHTIGSLPPANRALLAGTDASGGFNEGEYGTGLQTEEGKIQNLPALGAARTAAQLNPAANPAIGSTAVNTALIGQGQSAGELGRLPQEQANLAYQTNNLNPAQLQRQMYETENMPGAGAYMLHMDPATGQTSLVRNPLATIQSQLMQNSLGGVGSPTAQPIAAPSGTMYPPPASAGRTAPIGQTDLSVPPVSRPGASNDARQVEETPIDQHPNPVVQAAKDSQDAKIKASIADLKAQQKELEHRHQAGIAATYAEQLKNAVGGAGQGIDDYYKQAWQTLNNPKDPSWIGTALTPILGQ